MGVAALIRACKEMREAEKREDWDAAEIVGTPAQYWLGDRRVAAITVTLGLYALLFRSDLSDSQYERHTLNERGRECGDTGQLPAFGLPQEQPRGQGRDTN